MTNPAEDLRGRHFSCERGGLTSAGAYAVIRATRVGRGRTSGAIAVIQPRARGRALPMARADRGIDPSTAEPGASTTPHWHLPVAQVDADRRAQVDAARGPRRPGRRRPARGPRRPGSPP